MIINKRELDKFERWLLRFKPEYFKYYEKGYDKGEIIIRQCDSDGRFYHLYYKGKLLGTLVDR
ncbi:MAG: hypothetical protein ACLFPS_07895 [Clostridia bacterium]